MSSCQQEDAMQDLPARSFQSAETTPTAAFCCYRSTIHLIRVLPSRFLSTVKAHLSKHFVVHSILAPVPMASFCNSSYFSILSN